MPRIITNQNFPIKSEIERSIFVIRGNKELQELKIENIGVSDIRIDKITVQWNNTNLIEEIAIDGDKVWSKKRTGKPDR